MTKRVAIWNPASGSAPDESDLQTAVGMSTELVATTAEDPGTGQTAAAVEDGAEIVVACGGDGTVRACLDPLVGTNTGLAIIPLGTGNLLASNLGIEPGLDAARGIGEGTPRRIDIGRINGEAFAVMAGSGFDALMIRDANDDLKARLGTVAYVFSGIKNLRTNLVKTRIEIDGESWFDGRSSMVLIGNFGEISGGLEIFPDANPNDGYLDIAVMTANTLREWASVGGRLLTGKNQKFHLARRTKGRHIIVEHDVARTYELDGEDREPTKRLEIEVEPNALTIKHEGTN